MHSNSDEKWDFSPERKKVGRQKWYDVCSYILEMSLSVYQSGQDWQIQLLWLLSKADLIKRTKNRAIRGVGGMQASHCFHESEITETICDDLKYLQHQGCSGEFGNQKKSPTDDISHLIRTFLIASLKYLRVKRFLGNVISGLTQWCKAKAKGNKWQEAEMIIWNVPGMGAQQSSSILF